jgi:hypothetical protein
VRWGVEKRLEFIEFRLFWEGGINRADIIDHFGVSVPQASKDLTLYEEKAPGNLLYDKSAKRYMASPHFKPVFLEPHADMYLAQLQTEPLTGIIEDSWLAAVPAFDMMPVPHRSVRVDVLRKLVGAIRSRRALKIKYQSMNTKRPDPEWRSISPHAFGHDGLRWHARAFCHIDRKFKDFILSRCLDSGDVEEALTTSSSDRLWNEFFDVVLTANPALSDSQRAVIEQDYEMVGGTVTVPVRKALLYYFQKRLRLDIADKVDRPQEIPVVVSNASEFASALAEATA